MANSHRKNHEMNPQSASTLVWAAAAATIVGFMVMSPGGQFISYIVAVFLALVPTLFGSKMSRVVGGVILTISLFLAFQVYSAFKNEGDGYRKRVEDRSGKMPAPARISELDRWRFQEFWV
jgi:membrane protein implicated in regulation of membrane protease activity